MYFNHIFDSDLITVACASQDGIKSAEPDHMMGGSSDVTDPAMEVLEDMPSRSGLCMHVYVFASVCKFVCCVYHVNVHVRAHTCVCMNVLFMCM